MLCEMCKKNPATVHYTKVVNGLKEEKHLCEECAAKMKQSGEFNDFFSSFDTKHKFGLLPDFSMADFIGGFFNPTVDCLNVFNHKLVENFCFSQNGITFLPREMFDSSFLVSRPLKEYMPMKFLLLYRKGELTQDIMTLIRQLKNCIQQNIDISHPYSY